MKKVPLLGEIYKVAVSALTIVGTIPIIADIKVNINKVIMLFFISKN